MPTAALLQVEDVSELLFSWRLLASFPLIVLLGFVSGRLLGVRRSWAVSTLAGIAGWIAAVSLTTIIARSQEDPEAGFTRNLWLFSIVFTMSASVWVELLARPGALARARTGLTRVPRPLRAVRRLFQRLRRYTQISRIAMRHGLGPVLGLGPGPDADEVADSSLRRAPPAVRLRRALEECGGMFVKMGQVLSTRSDIVPAPFVTELSRLQDRVPPAGRPEVEALLAAEFDRPVDDVFAAFDWMPIAAASIGQAYRAQLRTGEPVIVKVQRPGIAEAVERDVQVLLQLARTAEARTPWAAEYHVTELAQEFADRLLEELDFRIEARNATEIGARLTDTPGVHVPKVYTELSTARVLVLEWFVGVSVRQTEAVDAMGADRAGLADFLLRASLQQMLVDGHFHADPHPGNVLVLESGGLGLIDFGAAGRLDLLQQASLRDMLLAVSRRDPAMLRQAVLDVATVRPGFDDEQLERALARFMARHLGPGSEPTAAMFNELLQMFFSFGINLPPEFSTFFRALVTLEGTLTTLRPGFNVIDAAQRVAGEWAQERLAPASLAELAKEEVLSLAPLLRRLPHQAERLATALQRGNLSMRVSLLSGAQDVRNATRLLNRVVLAFLGGVVGLMSVVLLGIDGGPPFTGDTSLFQFFGYFGLFCSTVLIMRVLVAVFQDGEN